jgi:hypothetical protein
MPGDQRNVTRVGPAFSLQLTDHLEAQGAVTFAVSSPDSLGDDRSVGSHDPARPEPRDQPVETTMPLLAFMRAIRRIDWTS